MESHLWEEEGPLSLRHATSVQRKGGQLLGASCPTGCHVPYLPSSLTFSIMYPTYEASLSKLLSPSSVSPCLYDGGCRNE